MGYDELAPNADKWLHADGSVTTLAGEMILPADAARAADFASRAASADKWLHEDGSVTDSNGNVLLEADATRAEDFATRLPEAVKGIISSGNGKPDSNSDNDVISVGFPLVEGWLVLLQPFVKGSEAINPAPLVISDGAALTFIPFAAGVETVTDNYIFTDTASAVLS
jgi:hypothetical protein